MLKFDPQYGLLCENTEEIRAQVRQIFIDAFGEDLDVDPESPQGQLIDSLTAIISDKDSQVLELANQFDPYKNDGIYQEAMAHLYFIERKGARASLVTCECRGLANTFIPRGTIIKNADNLLFYSINDAFIGANGKVEISFECEKTGAINIPLYSITSIVSVIPGFDSVINNNPALLGSEKESRAEFEKRRTLAIAKNGQGSLLSLYGELSQVDNVVDVLILENPTSVKLIEKNVEIEPHSIYIAISGGEDSAIARAIYIKKDAGCGTTGTHKVQHFEDITGAKYSYFINRPIHFALSMRVQIKLKADSKSDIESEIKALLLDDFYGRFDNYLSKRVGIGENIHASRFYLSLLNAGISELTKLELSIDGSNFSESIELDANQLPILLEENIELITSSSS